MSGRLDMTAMYTMHDALRRELRHIAEITANVDGDPGRILGTAVGWELFKKALHVHHTAEDEALWPVMRRALADRPDDLALLEAMEAEHAAVDPVVEAIDKEIGREIGREIGKEIGRGVGEAPAGGGSDPHRLGDLTDALVTGLSGHLKHEEDEALPLIQAVVTEQQWRHFGQVHGSLVGPDAPRIMPWMLDGATPQTVATVLAPLPEPARAAFQDRWRPAYAALDRWSANTAS